MGKSLSVIKRQRQNDKKQLMNRFYKERIKKTKKAIRKLMEEKAGKEELMKAYSLYTSALDKAVKKNVIHLNNSSRKKSRMNTIIKNFVLGSAS